DIILSNCTESRQLHFDVVLARLQARDVIYAGVVANHGTRNVCSRIGDRDTDAGNHRARGIVNYTADTRLRLRDGGYKTQENHAQCRHKAPSAHSSSAQEKGFVGWSLAKPQRDENFFGSCSQLSCA